MCSSFSSENFLLQDYLKVYTNQIKIMKIIIYQTSTHNGVLPRMPSGHQPNFLMAGAVHISRESQGLFFQPWWASPCLTLGESLGKLISLRKHCFRQRGVIVIESLSIDNHTESLSLASFHLSSSLLVFSPETIVPMIMDRHYPMLIQQHKKEAKKKSTWNFSVYFISRYIYIHLLKSTFPFRQMCLPIYIPIKKNHALHRMN